MNFLVLVLAAQVATSTSVVPKEKFDRVAVIARDALSQAETYKLNWKTCEETKVIEARHEELKTSNETVAKEAEELKEVALESKGIDPILLSAIVGGVALFAGAIAGFYFGSQGSDGGVVVVGGSP